MNRINYILVAIASVVMSTGLDGQVYSATTSVGQKIRIQADTTWTVFKNGDSTRSILNGDTLVESAKTAGASSTVAWLLGPDSAKVLRFEGSPPAHMTSLELTRFRGRLTRPNFGAEVTHEIESESGTA